MPLELTPDVKVSRDKNGIVRQLSHIQAYKAPVPGSALEKINATLVTPRKLAENYLRETAPIFGFTNSEVANFAAATEKTASNVGVELRFKEEKNVGTGFSIAYDQTVFGLPIWDAGVSVRIDGKKMGVTGCHNAAHYSIDVQQPSKTAPFLPHLMAPEKVAPLLNISTAEAITVNGTRLLVYYFESEKRYDSQISSHEKRKESTGVAGRDVAPFPTLNLPSIPASIIDKKHYVVTELLFTYSFEKWGPLNWRAFIEPESGAVLYLRALVSCVRGSVFLSDPVSATGQLLSAASPLNLLDQVRNQVDLLGLSPSDNGSQQLSGEFIKLVDIESPVSTMPAEASPFDFFYSSNTDNFAACNAYHHCDRFFRLIQGMGIDVNNYFNNTNFPVPVDPHALDGDVNAMAPGNSAGNGLGHLIFGSARQGSNIGISSDIRVVLHEFGHAVLWDHVDSPNFGFAHSPGDSFAAILQDPHTQLQDRFETFPFMNASVGLSRRHDRKVSEGWGWFGVEWDTQYGGEQVLSTTLFRVYQAAGGDSDILSEREFASRYVVYLILKAVSLLNFTTPDPDVFVTALTEADSTTDLFEGHPGGAFSKIFRWSFEKQGLYQADDTQPVTGPGLPPDFDVYINDGRNGEYGYTNDHTSQTEIWNRHNADGQTGNQPPVPGSINHAYVMISNRGTQPATQVRVTGFQSNTASPVNWPNDWQVLPQSVDVPGVIAPGQSVIAGPFDWLPEQGNNLVFSVSAPGDRSNIETVTAWPLPIQRLLLLDNNIAMKSF